MRFNLSMLFLPLAFAVSCKEKATTTKSMVVIDPVHYHAALVQKNHLNGVSDTVNVYAPDGEELDSYLATVESFNKRDSDPTHWKEIVHHCEDGADSLPDAKAGDFAVLACPNNKKPDYILSAIQKGYNVLSDKPLAIDSEGYGKLVEAYRLAERKGLLIYDLMTERYDALNILIRRLIADKEFFGKSEEVKMTSVHHFYKNVAGSALVRPRWYYDVRQQGEGIADVTTHLIDLVFWQCFPAEGIKTDDIAFTGSSHFPTLISLAEYRQSTGADSFPSYLDYCMKNSTIAVMSNGRVNFKVKDIPVSIGVRWDFEAPAGSGDTFESEYTGSGASIRIIQDSTTDFKKKLILSASANSVTKAYERLKADFPSLAIEAYNNGSWAIDLDESAKLGHEDHFSLVCEAFLNYLDGGSVPSWEKDNTLTRYYITTEAVKTAENNIYTK